VAKPAAAMIGSAKIALRIRASFVWSKSQLQAANASRQNDVPIPRVT